MSSNAVAEAPPAPGLVDRITGMGDVLVAVTIVGIVVMMIIPVPPLLLDVLLTANISLALSVVLATIYSTEPLQFSIFPSLLLVTTLFRLALNISSTRLILLHGNAGSVIHAFGQFVVGGNIVVGLIVFTILIVIQFVVITNGAGRVAEVAARFTLDAMPGKQMAIDADLNAGVITDEEAQKRRRTISKEADFYGAMDGASKFVKGDAIAAVMIVVINLLGGMAVGVLQQGLAFSDAIHHFSLLSVGEGLVNQIPALLISTATGIIVTRAAGESDMGKDLTKQLTAQPRALLITGIVVAGLAIVPGLPKPPFVVIGGAILGSLSAEGGSGSFGFMWFQWSIVVVALWAFPAFWIVGWLDRKQVDAGRWGTGTGRVVPWTAIESFSASYVNTHVDPHLRSIWANCGSAIEALRLGSRLIAVSGWPSTISNPRSSRQRSPTIRFRNVYADSRIYASNASECLAPPATAWWMTAAATSRTRASAR